MSEQPNPFSVVSDGNGVVATFRFRKCADEYLERCHRSAIFNWPLTVRHQGEVISAFWNERQAGLDHLGRGDA